jgi:Cu2+-exporting ATPase
MVALVQGGDLYFDAVTMLVFLTLGSRYLEARLGRRAIVGLDSPTLALRLRDGGARPATAPVDVPAGATRTEEHTEVVPASLLLPGDLVWVRAGDRIPADGLLTEGDGSCDESALTGEALPVPKRVDDPLFAGTLNLGQPLLLKVLRPLSASRLQQLRDSAQSLADVRALQPAWVDRVGHAYGLCMLAVALLAALGWWFVAPERAPGILLSVLVIACPCALAVAIPATIAAANSGLLRRGALVTQASVFEHVDGIDTVVLDKTGTLTRVQSARCTATGWRDALADDRIPDEPWLRAIAATLERHATHPYARLLAAAPTAGVGAPRDVRVEREGVSARLDGRHWRIGTARFALAGDAGQPNEAAARCTAGSAAVAPPASGVWLSCDGAAVARFDFELDVNPGVPQALAALRARGWALRIASGDAAASVEVVARVLGIPDWDAALSAEDKLALVQRLQAEGRRVLMVGDGTNDAAALARADIGVAVAPGTALCQASAGARLLRTDLRLLVELIDTAQHARRIMRSNLAWALGYNAIALPLAAFGLVAPVWAAVGMSLSSLVVVANALRAARVPQQASSGLAGRPPGPRAPQGALAAAAKGVRA